MKRGWHNFRGEKYKTSSQSRRLKDLTIKFSRVLKKPPTLVRMSGKQAIVLEDAVWQSYVQLGRLERVGVRRALRCLQETMMKSKLIFFDVCTGSRPGTFHVGMDLAYIKSLLLAAKDSAQKRLIVSKHLDDVLITLEKHQKSLEMRVDAQ